MIERLKGKVLEKGADWAVIQIAGMGFFLKITASALEKITPGQEAEVFTHLIIKDEEPILMGFSSKEEREVFKKLLSVSGIGPKTAMAILSTIGLESFLEAVERGNVSALSRVPGIGKKGASRIIVEMKNFIPSMAGESEAEIISALTNLGFKRSEVESVVREISGKGLPVEEAIKEALRRLS